MFTRLNLSLSVLTAFSLPLALCSNVLLSEAALAGKNRFEACLDKLLSSELTEETAAVACAGALEPEELSTCVAEIKQDTSITAEEALKACYQVRRPKDLAQCVVEINAKAITQQTTIKSESSEKASETEVTMDNSENEELTITPSVESEAETLDDEVANYALDTCRRSLLPKRFSRCVVALNQKLETITAMNKCIQAESYPPEVFSHETN